MWLVVGHRSHRVSQRDWEIEDVGYGYATSDMDPDTFSPDVECVTPAEFSAWYEARGHKKRHAMRIRRGIHQMAVAIGLAGCVATARAEERAGWREVAAIGQRMAALIAQWNAEEDAADGGEDDYAHAGMLMLAMTDEAEKFAAALRARGEG